MSPFWPLTDTPLSAAYRNLASEPSPVRLARLCVGYFLFPIASPSHLGNLPSADASNGCGSYVPCLETAQEESPQGTPIPQSSCLKGHSCWLDLLIQVQERADGFPSMQ